MLSKAERLKSAKRDRWLAVGHIIFTGGLIFVVIWLMTALWGVVGDTSPQGGLWYLGTLMVVVILLVLVAWFGIYMLKAFRSSLAAIRDANERIRQARI